MGNIYKIFIIAGAVLLAIGIGLFILQKLHIPVGRLPGDILISKKNLTFYFPITTSILISLLLSMILYICKR